MLINKYLNIIFIGIIFLFLLLFFKNCSKINNLEQAAFKSKLNEKALNDTIKYVKNKAGELQAEKAAFVGTYNEIKELNSELYAEIKKQSDHIITLTLINATLKNKNNSLIDSLRNSSVAIVFDSIKQIYIIKWDFNKKFNDKNYRILEGHTNFSVDSNKVINKGSIIDNDELKFNIVTGFEEENKQLKIYVKTDYPGLVFDKIDGALIDPNKSDIINKLIKKRKWHLSANIGYGIGITSFKPDFYLGIGGSYNIW